MKSRLLMLSLCALLLMIALGPEIEPRVSMSRSLEEVDAGTILPDKRAEYVDGPWIISGYEKRSHEQIVVNGSISVADGALLVLENVTLELNPDSDNDIGLLVGGGGSLVVNHSAISSASGHSYFMSFGEMAASATTHLKEVEVHDLGVNGMDMTNCQDVIIRGCDIEPRHHGITAYDSAVYLEECSVTGGDIALFLNDGRVTVVDCELTGYEDRGVYMDGTAQANVTGGSITGGEIGIALMNPGPSIDLVGTVIRDQSKHGIYSMGGDVNMKGCHVHNTTTSCLAAYDGDIKVENTIFEGGDYGLYLNETKGEAGNNTVSAATYGFALLNGGEMDLNGNEVTGCEYGMIVVDSNCNIIKGRYHNNTNIGIYSENSEILSDGGKVENNNEHGIFSVSSRVEVSGSMFKGNRNDGIYLDGGTAVVRASEFQQNSDCGLEGGKCMVTVNDSYFSGNKKSLELSSSSAFVNHSSLEGAAQKEIMAFANTSFWLLNTTVSDLLDGVYMEESDGHLSWPVVLKLTDARGDGIANASLNLVSAQNKEISTFTGPRGYTPVLEVRDVDITADQEGSISLMEHNPYHIEGETGGHIFNFTESFEGCSSREISVPNSPPPHPKSLVPGNGSVLTSVSVELSWEEAEEGDYNDEIIQYHVLLGPADQEPESYVTGESHVSLDLDDNTIYLWQVASEDSYGLVGQYSPLNYFAVDRENQAPTAPVITGPEDGAEVADTALELRWTPSMDPDPWDILRYRVEISTEPGIDSPLTSWVENGSRFTPDGLDYDVVYHWRVTAVDQEGLENASEVQSFTVWRGNRPPVIIGTIPDQNGKEDQTWTVNLGRYESDDSDVGPTLNWYVTDYNKDLVRIFGDYSEDDTFTFVPLRDAYGSTNATFHLVDSEGESAEQTVRITIEAVNDPPVFIQPPNLVVHYDEDYRFDYRPYIQDVDNDDEDISLSTDHDHASVIGTAITYNYPGSMLGMEATVGITASDGIGSGTTFVKVKITDDQVPKASEPLPDIEMLEGENRGNVFNLDDYFYDLDDDNLYYSYGYSYIEVNIADNHSVSVSSPGEWYGRERVTFRATDPKGALWEESINVTVLPVNDPPVIMPIPSLVVRFDLEYFLDMGPYIMDSDNETSELTLESSDDHVSFRQEPSSGSLQMVVLYPHEFNGTVQEVRINISDGIDSAYTTLSVSVGPHYPPTADNYPGTVRMHEDELFEHALYLDRFFSDPEGGAMTYSFFNNGSVGVNISNNSSVSLIPARDWYGTVPVTFRATDTGGAIAEFTTLIVVEPVNDPPVVSLPEKLDVTAGRNEIFDLGQYISDVDNIIDEIRISVSSDLDTKNGEKVVMVSGYLLILNYPPGSKSDTLAITVEDGLPGGSTTVSVEVIVLEAGDAVGDETTATGSPEPPGNAFYLAIIIILILILAGLGYFAYKGHYTVEETFLILGSGGTLLSHISLMPEGERDPDIISSMLTAVQDFVADAFTEGKERGLDKLQFGDKTVLLERGEYVYLAVVIKGSDGIELHKRLRHKINEIEVKYRAQFENWKGFIDELEGVDEILADL